MSQPQSPQTPSGKKVHILEQKGEAVMLRGASFMAGSGKVNRLPKSRGAPPAGGADETPGDTTPVGRVPAMVRGGPTLLPATPRDSTKKYTIVLDLDETVIYARDGPLYARAHLKDMLRAMDKYAEVIVWTAGERQYAQAIMREINCENIIQHLVYRHRRWFDPKDYTKDLTQLGRDMDYVLIIENTPDCVRANPSNGIIVEDFEGITNEQVDESTKEAPEASLGKGSGADQRDAEGNDEESNPDEPPSPPPEPSTPGNTPSTPSPGDSSSMPAAPPRRRRRARDNTLLYLMEIVEQLGQTDGMTVPTFLAQCSLLKQQYVETSDGSELPIFYLAAKRRARGSAPLKTVKLNRDKVEPQHIATLPPRLTDSKVATAVNSATVSPTAETPGNFPKTTRRRSVTPPAASVDVGDDTKAKKRTRKEANSPSQSRPSSLPRNAE